VQMRASDQTTRRKGPNVPRKSDYKRDSTPFGLSGSSGSKPGARTASGVEVEGLRGVAPPSFPETSSLGYTSPKSIGPPGPPTVASEEPITAVSPINTGAGGRSAFVHGEVGSHALTSPSVWSEVSTNPSDLGGSSSSTPTITMSDGSGTAPPSIPSPSGGGSEVSVTDSEYQAFVLALLEPAATRVQGFAMLFRRALRWYRGTTREAEVFVQEYVRQEETRYAMACADVDIPEPSVPSESRVRQREQYKARRVVEWVEKLRGSLVVYDDTPANRMVVELKLLDLFSREDVRMRYRGYLKHSIVSAYFGYSASHEASKAESRQFKVFDYWTGLFSRKRTSLD